jgi:hypothetical protein
MRRRIADERSEDEGFRVVRIEHIEAGPTVMRKFKSQPFDDALLQDIEGSGEQGEMAKPF